MPARTDIAIEKGSMVMATGIVVIETGSGTETTDIERGTGTGRETGTRPGVTTGAETMEPALKGSSTTIGGTTIDVASLDAMRIVVPIVARAKKAHPSVVDEEKKKLVPLRGDHPPQKDASHCLSADARLQVGTSMLLDTNSIPPCRQNKQVSSIFPVLTVLRFHPFSVSQVYLPLSQSKRLEWALAATLTCLGNPVAFTLAASHQKLTNRTWLNSSTVR